MRRLAHEQQRIEADRVARPLNLTDRWSPADDDYLWEHRKQPHKQLAETLFRTTEAITVRLAELRKRKVQQRSSPDSRLRMILNRKTKYFSTHLSDRQLGAILMAAEDERTAALARRIHAPFSAVREWRRRIRNGTCACMLVWSTCEVCGKPIASRATAIKLAHKHCRRRRLAARQRRERQLGKPYRHSTRYVREWRERNPERAEQLREREYLARRERGQVKTAEQKAKDHAALAAYDQRVKAETRAQASRMGEPWSEEEDELLVKYSHLTIREVALALNRTSTSVKSRRHELTKRGLITEHGSITQSEYRRANRKKEREK